MSRLLVVGLVFVVAVVVLGAIVLSQPGVKPEPVYIIAPGVIVNHKVIRELMPEGGVVTFTVPLDPKGQFIPEDAAIVWKDRGGVVQVWLPRVAPAGLRDDLGEEYAQEATFRKLLQSSQGDWQRTGSWTIVDLPQVVEDVLTDDVVSRTVHLPSQPAGAAVTVVEADVVSGTTVSRTIILSGSDGAAVNQALMFYIASNAAQHRADLDAMVTMDRTHTHAWVQNSQSERVTWATLLGFNELNDTARFNSAVGSNILIVALFLGAVCFCVWALTRKK